MCCFRGLSTWRCLTGTSAISCRHWEESDWSLILTWILTFSCVFSSFYLCPCLCSCLSLYPCPSVCSYLCLCLCLYLFLYFDPCLCLYFYLYLLLLRCHRTMMRMKPPCCDTSHDSPRRAFDQTHTQIVLWTLQKAAGWTGQRGHLASKRKKVKGNRKHICYWIYNLFGTLAASLLFTSFEDILKINNALITQSSL